MKCSTERSAIRKSRFGGEAYNYADVTNNAWTEWDVIKIYEIVVIYLMS